MSPCIPKLIRQLQLVNHVWGVRNIFVLDLSTFRKDDTHFFQKLKNNERQNLCDRVKKFAKLEGQDRMAYKYFLKGEYNDNVISHQVKLAS